MKDVYILGIESSCDETSMSIVKNGSEEIATIVLSQIDIHKNYGGVVPEIASRNHIENITIVLEELLSKANMKLEEREIRGLLDQLLILENPFTCPHGRPTAIKMTKNDIEKKFARR